MHNGVMATHTHDLFDEDKAAWLEDLQEGLLCLVLHSNSAPLLQETASALQTLWTQAQAGQVETFDGAHCQDIIRRFNELVASFSASIAALPPDPEHPAHLWVVHQAQSLSAEQIHLLGQMLVHLPGVNIRMVLLYEGAAPFDAWEEATQGQVDTHELIPPPPPLIDLIDFAADAPPDEPLPVLEPTTESPSSPDKRRQWIVAGLAGAALFALGFTTGRISSPASPTPATAEPLATQAPPSVEAAPAAPLPQAAAPVKVAALPTPATPAAPPASAAPQATWSQALSSDVQWLRRLPSNSFVVAHDSFADLASAQAFKTKHPILKTARIVPVKSSAGVRFLVISGPFRSEERTRGFVSRLEWKKSVRVQTHPQVLDSMNAALGG